MNRAKSLLLLLATCIYLGCVCSCGLFSKDVWARAVDPEDDFRRLKDNELIHANDEALKMFVDIALKGSYRSPIWFYGVVDSDANSPVNQFNILNSKVKEGVLTPVPDNFYDSRAKYISPSLRQIYIDNCLVNDSLYVFVYCTTHASESKHSPVLYQKSMMFKYHLSPKDHKWHIVESETLEGLPLYRFRYDADGNPIIQP